MGWGGEKRGEEGRGGDARGDTRVKQYSGELTESFSGICY